MLGALTGSGIVDHVGRRKLLLTGISCAAVGMFIVGFLLSPIGEESKTRADAGISFICKPVNPSMRHQQLILSPLHGCFLLWLDASTRSLPGRGIDLREPCQRALATRLDYQFMLSHQHFRSSSRPEKGRIHQSVYHSLWIALLLTFQCTSSLVPGIWWDSL